ncbi:MAG: RagB/SusD family nutrient uptake outer membrane protein [Clostridium sp.]|nr:RagB/SusD family nutrient uptake outer membrane protein [Clostridium sp.]
MKRLIRYITLLCLAPLTLTGCSDWLEVRPYDQMSEDDLLSTEDGFKKLLNGIYIDLNKDELYGQTLTVEMVELMGGSYLVGTDPLIWGDYIDLNNRNFTGEYWSNRLDQTWNKAYGLIRNCNTLLEKMEEQRGVFTGDNYNLIRGEALALRALLHFDMFRLFGPVYKLTPEKESIPYVTTTGLQVQELLPGTEVMTRIITDLQQAEALLQNDPIRTTKNHLTATNQTAGDNFTQYRTLRLNYYAVQALLARAYHYVAAYPGAQQAEYRHKAMDYAQGIIAIAPDHFPWVDKANILGSPENMDRIFASEVIFGLTNMNRNLLFKNNNDPNHSPKPVLRMNPALVDAPYFGESTEGGSPDDYRYIANWRKNGNDYYFYKYADITNTGSIENTIVPMIRLGEMYLIMADLYGDLNDRPTMGHWANLLREHRGVEPMDESSYAPRHLNYERVRELYGEGQLFFQYKRNYASILVTFESPSEFMTASEKLYVVPLPDTETDNRQ